MLPGPGPAAAGWGRPGSRCERAPRPGRLPRRRSPPRPARRPRLRAPGRWAAAGPGGQGRPSPGSTEVGAAEGAGGPECSSDSSAYRSPASSAARADGTWCAGASATGCARVSGQRRAGIVEDPAAAQHPDALTARQRRATARSTGIPLEIVVPGPVDGDDPGGRNPAPAGSTKVPGRSKAGPARGRGRPGRDAGDPDADDGQRAEHGDGQPARGGRASRRGRPEGRVQTAGSRRCPGRGT